MPAIELRLRPPEAMGFPCVRIQYRYDGFAIEFNDMLNLMVRYRRAARIKMV